MITKIAETSSNDTNKCVQTADNTVMRHHSKVTTGFPAVFSGRPCQGILPLLCSLLIREWNAPSQLTLFFARTEWVWTTPKAKGDSECSIIVVFDIVTCYMLLVCASVWIYMVRPIYRTNNQWITCWEFLKSVWMRIFFKSAPHSAHMSFMMVGCLHFSILRTTDPAERKWIKIS